MIEPRDLYGEVYPGLLRALRIGVILLGAFLASRLAGWLVARLRLRIGAAPLGTDLENEKRATTIGGLLANCLRFVVWTFAIIWSLRVLGLDVTPILASAGVIGLAVGFGAQNLVRDVISGLFMLLEDQVRVGDVVEVNGKGGAVEEISLRTIVLRGLDGAVHIFPHGAITSLSNLTRWYSFYVFDVAVAFGQDPDQVVQLLREVAEGLRQDPAFQSAILDALEVLGVDRFAESEVHVKARLKTLPGQQWNVGREMNRRMVKRLAEEGIQVAPPRRGIALVKESFLGPAEPRR
jgi:small conductance mechanosensitive channel